MTATDTPAGQDVRTGGGAVRTDATGVDEFFWGGTQVTTGALRSLCSGGVDSPMSGADRRALAAAGWLGPDGSPTPAGKGLCAELSGGVVLTVYRVDGGVRRTAEVRGGETRLLWIVQEGQNGSGPTCRFQVLPVDAVPLLLGRWGGLAATLGTDGRTYGPFEADRYDARLADDTVPAPEDADEATRRVWEAPWFAWGAQSSDGSVALHYVVVSGVGTLVVRREDDGSVVLAERPSSLLWGDLQALWPRLRDGADPADW